ncbi:tyrosine-type recombinase/integrase [Neptunitalea lumnitzerae]|uniref:Tyr recombinase domain-containing protein n=1 Tax=Neptunitalea lumnitzerae TaxID=2965509 RepID=A0ABQ5ME84_9FLAO|nr:tyrosine-type recombinase/integrase [Neptunitalea sp. Y10]GLB47689.1 hypothetical protein Y10_00570 [Neptunitalea sp. Y10]
MKLNYSEPKIFTGGVDISSWSKLHPKEKEKALSKDWYVYYSFREPKSGKLKRQTNIKGGANKFKNKKERYHILRILQKSLLIVLEQGYNPYADNKSLGDYLIDKLNNQGQQQPQQPVRQPQQHLVLHAPNTNHSETETSIKQAFNLALELKSNVMNNNSFTKYKSRITRFEKWLLAEGYTNNSYISDINKKTVIQYLNNVLQSSSPRNRNNTRTDIASFFQVLEDNEIIKENFVKNINVLKAIPERNKTYKPKEEKEIFDYLRETDPILLLFVQFVSYNFLRPIEVCRLRIGDIDVADKKLYVRAKNQPVKTKIIPDILLRELPDISKSKTTNYLFTPDIIGGEWDIEETNKRDYFTKRFKKVKDHFNLGVDYGLYSFRHTFITKLYREMAKNTSPSEVKSRLQLITGHSTIKALEQ